ncbi:hypothetical protein U14_01393 [Candidatus Moduliflexus flocculans]|uniref:Uncharacterized protein n=1 Tax=Candidatus Moduliflexus flocculans TaxID=1499966 RepID=A0A0S6VY01_9BACT|nr:hypothetical protein U14_01393 [Candidatus Moduliflexus flocculans]
MTLIGLIYADFKVFNQAYSVFYFFRVLRGNYLLIKNVAKTALSLSFSPKGGERL